VRANKPAVLLTYEVDETYQVPLDYENGDWLCIEKCIIDPRTQQQPR